MRVGSELIEYAASTHVGLKRSRNEDCYEADSTLGLWLVADGVGGHSGGDIASAIVKMTIRKEVSRGVALVTAIRQAHVDVLKEIDRLGTNMRMGSTVVGLTMEGDEYTLAWVGDSRAYLWDGVDLQQLTRDHSHVRDLVDRGLLASEDVATHPDRNAITQSLGISSDMNLEPGEIKGQLQFGQQILLCSDGLTDELPDKTISEHLRAHSSIQEQVDALLHGALEAGGRDNVTLVVVGVPCSGARSGSTRTDPVVPAWRKLPWLLLTLAAVSMVAVILLWD
jgi:serine/threonine protein phosphatase PrpC